MKRPLQGMTEILTRTVVLPPDETPVTEYMASSAVSLGVPKRVPVFASMKSPAGSDGSTEKS